MEQKNNQNYNSIGKRILKLRRERGWKSAELAKKVNVTDKAIWKWENDRGEPSLECLILLAKVFDVSLDYLIIGSHKEDKNESNNNYAKQGGHSDMQYVISGKIIPCGKQMRARTHAELLNIILGKNMKAYYRCLYKIEDNYYVWMINLSQSPSRFGWVNVQEGTNIIERYVGAPKDQIEAHKTYVGDQLRYVFDIKYDENGRYYEFKGLYHCKENCTENLRIWEPEK